MAFAFFGAEPTRGFSGRLYAAPLPVDARTHHRPVTDCVTDGGFLKGIRVDRATSNSVCGCCNWPSETHFAPEDSAAVQSVRTRIFRLRVGIRVTW